jgi:drug/metabolite transporter (DMT)-like permease
MILATLMWSSAGVITRQLEATPPLEVTFWRSVFATLTVVVWIAVAGGPAPARTDGRAKAAGDAERAGGAGSMARRHRLAAIAASGLMWAIMFTCFTVALSLTRVANVLIVQSLAPVFTALLAWWIFRRPIGRRTWIAIAVAALGVAAMYAFDLSGLDARHGLGLLIAIGIPLASAVNWIIVQRHGAVVDLARAVLLGAVVSAVVVLPWTWPLRAPLADIGWLAVMGILQLGIPCVIAMRAAPALAAPTAALLALAEVPFGIGWAWWLSAEQPGSATLWGGACVLAALVYSEAGSARPPAASTMPAPLPKDRAAS